MLAFDMVSCTWGLCGGIHKWSRYPSILHHKCLFVGVDREAVTKVVSIGVKCRAAQVIFVLTQ